MEKKITGFFGIAITILFILSFSIFYIFINPNAFINELSLVMYNFEGLYGRDFVCLFNYSFVGLMMIFFNILLLNNFDNSATNLVGKLSLLISSFCYASAGFIARTNDFNSEISNVNIFQYTGVLLFGFFGFFFLSFDFEKICNLKIIKKIITVVYFYILIEFILHLICSLNDLKYPPIIAKTTWLVYFLTYGIIGYYIIINNKSLSKK